jgi:hypothetical protein
LGRAGAGAMRNSKIVRDATRLRLG